MNSRYPSMMNTGNLYPTNTHLPMPFQGPQNQSLLPFPLINLPDEPPLPYVLNSFNPPIPPKLRQNFMFDPMNNIPSLNNSFLLNVSLI